MATAMGRGGRGLDLHDADLINVPVVMVILSFLVLAITGLTLLTF